MRSTEDDVKRKLVKSLLKKCSSTAKEGIDSSRDKPSSSTPAFVASHVSKAQYRPKSKPTRPKVDIEGSSQPTYTKTENSGNMTGIEKNHRILDSSVAKAGEGSRSSRYLVKYLSDGNFNTKECDRWDGSLTMDPERERAIAIMPTVSGTEMTALKTGVEGLILFEDEYLLVLYKPPTVLAQSDLKGEDESLFDAARRYLGNSENENREGGKSNPGLHMVHRIDRPCSGVILLAKNAKVCSELSKAFQLRQIEKRYMAVVNGQISEKGRCEDDLLVQARPGTKTRVRAISPDGSSLPSSSSTSSTTTSSSSSSSSSGAVHAWLDYEPVYSIEKKGIQTLVKVDLGTGRKHQIRAQLGKMNHPIVGDQKYGAQQAFKMRDIALHAYALKFLHPVKQTHMDIRCSPPNIWRSRFGEEAFQEMERITYAPIL